MPPFVRKASGVDGRVTLPDMGALIGYFTHWDLYNQQGDDYDFRANLGFINRRLWEQVDPSSGEPYRKQVVIDFGKSKRYRLNQHNGALVQLDGTQLLMEHVTLEPYEGR